MRILLLAISVITGVCGQRYLAVENGEFHLNGEKIFQSGMNIAWNQFGADFGNGQYDCCTGSQLEKYIRDIASSGGNSIRKRNFCW
jgi:mannan endo-1,4-beta-mannosidase